ncbi:helix-turn-helix domain-containing protein [Pseudoduganella violaceinigra]|uniref:helix-turn-helix domain-containing protein n=1 Tax=Pseudoduganella violaceinigra TaxID=246602 RepID=UPI000A045E38
MINQCKHTLLRMRTLQEIADFLRIRLGSMGLTQQSLGEHAGISRRTLTGVLNGARDYKITTLMSILDRLGYELVIVPKGAATGLSSEQGFAPSPPAVKTRVQLARERLEAKVAEDQNAPPRRRLRFTREKK